jgi:hypothetical protein
MSFCNPFFFLLIFNSVSVSNFNFVLNTPLSLNIVIKLNEKIRKIIKNILIILHISVKFNKKKKKI